MLQEVSIALGFHTISQMCLILTISPLILSLNLISLHPSLLILSSPSSVSPLVPSSMPNLSGSTDYILVIIYVTANIQT